MEAWNVGDRVVDEGVEADGVGAAIREGEESVAGRVGEAGAESAE